MNDGQIYGEGADVSIRVSLVNGNLDPRIFRAFGSVDGGISYRFVGTIFEGVSFVAQPPFLRFDAEDRKAIEAAVAAHFPDLKFQKVKVPPVGLDGRHDDDPEREEEPKKTRIYIP